ncbi:amino acid permease-domain-containing protein [Verticillium dahliae]|nr:amino acid permease-domain-containing protein [Verticillium dahliae]
MGWTYFFASTMLVCVEYSAVATVMQYWDRDTNPAAWIAMAMVVCFLLNVVAVRWFGESEFIMASTKVLLLLGLVLITLITMSGGNPQGDAYGFRNWGAGAMHSYYAEGGTGRLLGWWSVVIYAGFTIAGPDMIALAAGEIQNPRRTIPRVAQHLYRIVGFYVVGVLAVGIICSSRDPRLVGAIKNGEPGAAASPWVIGIENLGIGFLPHLINALIMLSGWSCGNAYLSPPAPSTVSLAPAKPPPSSSSAPKQACPSTASSSSQPHHVHHPSGRFQLGREVFFWFVDLTTATRHQQTFMRHVRCVLLPPQGKAPRGPLPPYVAPTEPYAPVVSLLCGCTALVFVGFDVFSPFSIRGFDRGGKMGFIAAKDADLVSEGRD